MAEVFLPLDLTDDKSTLVQVMAWCHQATSHYLSQCWPRSLSPYGVTRPQSVNSLQASQAIWCHRSWLKILEVGGNRLLPDGTKPLPLLNIDSSILVNILHRTGLDTNILFFLYLYFLSCINFPSHQWVDPSITWKNYSIWPVFLKRICLCNWAKVLQTSFEYLDEYDIIIPCAQWSWRGVRKRRIVTITIPY